MFTLLFKTTPTQLIVSGNTFPIKECLKALGGVWNSPNWILPLKADSPLTRANLVENCRRAILKEKEASAARAAAAKAHLAYFSTPQAVKDALKAKAAGSPSYHWICCDQCVVIDWFKQHTSCQACGQDNGAWKETFFVRGRLRTGD